MHFSKRHTCRTYDARKTPTLTAIKTGRGDINVQKKKIEQSELKGTKKHRALSTQTEFALLAERFQVTDLRHSPISYALSFQHRVHHFGHLFSFKQGAGLTRKLALFRARQVNSGQLPPTHLLHSPFLIFLTCCQQKPRHIFDHYENGPVRSHFLLNHLAVMGSSRRVKPARSLVDWSPKNGHHFVISERQKRNVFWTFDFDLACNWVCSRFSSLHARINS